ncbi:MAG TPA: cytochrome c [Alphaproteobacteria bacterium]|jgi:mono/diheme cytochrome c family protein|nr:cytochrome c [Alphaproteobacteria bacterium]
MDIRAAIAVAFGLALCGTLSSRASADESYSQVERGKYLVDAGDCAACHTSDDSKPFAGGRPIETPFGVLYTSNITPNRRSGIGAWTDDEFYKAMHEGIGRGGKKLYPAFPYPYFTHLSHEDVGAIRAYLTTIAPVDNSPPPNRLEWPLNYRFMMTGWNTLFFKDGEYKKNPDKTPEWNRGAYLVEGAEHCGACHTAKNMFGADKTDHRFEGGNLQHWFAPKLVNDRPDGIGTWSADEIVQYLKTGRNAKSGATGPMAEVVKNSTSKLKDGDLHAIAAYLKDLPGTGEQRSASKTDDKVVAAGKDIYDASCSACHKSSGEGVPFMFSPLKASAAVQSGDPTTVIRMVLGGARTQVTKDEPTPSTMPAYAWKLSDDEIAAVVTYIRNAWGNSASSVSASDVKDVREDIRKDVTASSAQ